MTGQILILQKYFSSYMSSLIRSIHSPVNVKHYPRITIFLKTNGALLHWKYNPKMLQFLKTATWYLFRNIYLRLQLQARDFQMEVWSVYLFITPSRGTLIFPSLLGCSWGTSPLRMSRNFPGRIPHSYISLGGKMHLFQVVLGVLPNQKGDWPRTSLKSSSVWKI